MRGSDNKVPLLAAIFVALLFASMPGTVQAQNVEPPEGVGGNASLVTGSPADGPQGNLIGEPMTLPLSPIPWFSSNPCTGMTGIALCQCQMYNAHLKRSYDRLYTNVQFFQNAPILNMKLAFCWNAIASTIIPIMNALTIGGSGSLFGALAWIIIQTILGQIIQWACQLVVQTINAAWNFVKNLICIPLPHINLTLTGLNFHSQCNGISLFNLLGLIKPTTPTNWQLWNYNPVTISP